MVTTGDKLPNARAIAPDYQIEGPAVWSRFNKATSQELIVQYY